MNIRKHIPNAITLINVFCGSIAVIYLIKGNVMIVPILFLIGIIADYFDGFIARLLNAKSPIGKELDSLADMITFGLLPGAIMFYLLGNSFTQNFDPLSFLMSEDRLPFEAFIITMFSALRLAKFNVDETQSESFKGLATPACSVFVIGLLLISTYEVPFFLNIVQNPYFLLICTIILSGLLVSNIPMFSFKMADFGWKGNEIRFLFLIICVILLITFKFAGVALCIIAYIILSIINNIFRK